MGLYQIQLFCPFDGFPAAVDIEFTVDALGMCADSAQRNYKVISDLRPRKFGCEQAENFKLTLAERLNEEVRSGRGEARSFDCARRLLACKCGQQLGRK